MSKKKVVVVEGRWEGLNPEILALIFVRIMPVDEMVRCVPCVCKPWMEVVAGPYCWRDIDVAAWCRRRNDTHAVDLVVRKLVRRSRCTVQRLSAYRLGESGFFLIANCGRCLKVLQIPMSSITDQMVLKHIKPLPNLRVLDISHCYKITAKGVAALGEQCKSLVHLKRNMAPLQDWSVGVDDSEARSIAETMASLQHIELRYGVFGDVGVSEIVRKCKGLSHLDIEGSWNVELNGDVEEMCERLEYFQGPGVDEDEDEFSSSSSSSESSVDSGSESESVF